MSKQRPIVTGKSFSLLRDMVKAVQIDNAWQRFRPVSIVRTADKTVIRYASKGK